ncbi:transmembrane 7 superfamily member 3-like [Periplaneta americana]|uniref:transmembrane 7 superfamily member 3-like n=1 Tax=Periplaneta americana TaxID=6978 RepID=UPI0037E74E97
MTLTTLHSILTTIALCFVCVLGLLYSGDCSVVIRDGELNVSLADYNVSFQPGHIVKNMRQLPAISTLTLNVVNIPDKISFIIVQAHAFQFNVTLSYYDVLNRHFYANGTNLGLVEQIDKDQSGAKFYIINGNEGTNVSVLITIQGYGDEAPIPGGCNMEFSVKTAPYQIMRFTNAMVIVDSQPASPPQPYDKPAQPCEAHLVNHEMYHMYLPERDFTDETYFNALLKMMTVEDIQINGRKVPEPMEGSPMRRSYSAYPGTGSVYGIVAKYGKTAAAYVPAFTYACNTVYWTDSCDVLNTTFSKVLCATIFFMGFFVCVYGHQFFKTEMFLLGFLSGGLVSYILIALLTTYSGSVITVISVIMGLCFGILWLGLWCCYGIPVCSVLLATITLGFVVASIGAYAWLGDVDVLKNDFNFWMVFACVVMVVPILFLSLIQKANMISCAVLGAYAVIIPIDHYIGSNLKYIIVNIIRRATVKQFRMAIVDPPFQVKDTVLCILWIALAAVGITIQWYKQRGKPPFPPPPFLRYRERFRRSRFTPTSNVPTEQTPLLIDADVPPIRIPYITTSRSSDDVFESPHRPFKYLSFLKIWRTS